MTAVKKPIIKDKGTQLSTALITLLLAVVLASHQVSQYAVFGVFGSYLYWICRLLIEAGCFIAVLLALQQFLPRSSARLTCVILAIALSLIPFTLSITAFDLILGLPELGIFADTEVSGSRLRAFGWELVYLFDNHLAVCLMLSLPQFLESSTAPTEATTNDGEQSGNSTNTEVDNPESTDSGIEPGEMATAFFDTLDPPLAGKLRAIEAQEHYINVTTTSESRMILHRFSDAVSRLPASTGMQIHRSHWVAHSAVKRLVIDGQSIKIELDNGDLLPVSRTFHAAVKARHLSDWQSDGLT